MDRATRGSYRVPVPGVRRSVTTGAVVAALLLPACSPGGEGTSALPSGPPATSGGPSTAAGSTIATAPSPSPATEEAEVLTVYSRWWDALESAYARGDPADPRLDDYAVDPILSRQRASIRDLQAQGIVQRTSFTLRPRLLHRTGNYAEVEDCVRGPANTYYDAVSGRPRAPRGYRNDVPTEDRLLMTLQRRGDRWYVVAATGKGEVRC